MPVTFQNPLDLLGSARLRSNGRVPTFSYDKLCFRNRKLITRLHERSDQRLVWLLVGVLQLDPLRRPYDMRDPNLI